MIQVESPKQDADPKPPLHREIALFIRQQHSNNLEWSDLGKVKLEMVRDELMLLWIVIKIFCISIKETMVTT